MSELPDSGLLKFVKKIDFFTDFTGNIIAWISVPLMLIVVYEVFARYFFNAPTVWAYDMIYMLYGTLFMLGAAYALHKGAHIRTDFFWDRWSVRTKGIIDAIAYVLLFFPSLIALFIVSGGEGLYAMRIGETSEQTAWRPYLWPLKLVVPITCFLLLIQGVSETIKSLYAWKTGIELEQKEKIEV